MYLKEETVKSEPLFNLVLAHCYCCLCFLWEMLTALTCMFFKRMN